MKILHLTYEQFLVFKKEYNKAIKSNKTSFQFYNHEFLVSYAKYLIEYLEPQFKE